MKAKMPPGQKIPEAAEYLCQKCDTRFFYAKEEPLRCPNCYTTNINWIVAVYMEDDPVVEEMFSIEDMGEGD